MCLHLACKRVFMSVHGGVCVSRRECVQIGLCVYQCGCVWVQTTHRGSSLRVSSPSPAPASLLPQISEAVLRSASFFFPQFLLEYRYERPGFSLYGSASS